MVLWIFQSHHIKIKKAYSVDMIYTAGSQNYVSKIGINLYPLPVGKYTIVMEYYFPENINITIRAEASTATILKQTTKNFPDYEKILVQFDQKTKDTPDYLFFIISGSGTTSTNPEGYLIFYGIKGIVDVLPPEIYDHALESSMFEFDDGQMKMNMDLDLNGNNIVGQTFPFYLQGWCEQAKDSHGIYFTPASEVQIIPVDCVLKEIVFYIKTDNYIPPRLALDVTTFGNASYNIFQIATNRRDKVEVATNISINKKDLIKFRFPVVKENSELQHVQKAVFSYYFVPR